jgi:hypothetical protein
MKIRLHVGEEPAYRRQAPTWKRGMLVKNTNMGEGRVGVEHQHGLGQQILKCLRNEESELLPKLLVNTKDRKYQVWQRNSLGIELRNGKVFLQKLEYIHYNPVKAGLCALPEDYLYSSARFYELNVNDWDFLTHYED